MIKSHKLSTLLLVSACIYLPTYGMSAQDRIAQAKQEQKEERDTFESFIILNEAFEEVANGGSIIHKFRDHFDGLDGKAEKFVQKDNIEQLKDACMKAKAGKSVKFIIEDVPFFDYRIKVFALCGKNKTHFVVKFSESQHLEFLPDGSVLK